nr:hypothetical protein [Bordetella genomosp. 4]
MQVLQNIAGFLTLRTASQPVRGWFTIAPMLQDLDQLAARIGQLVQRTRQLQAERDALRISLGQSEAAQRALEQRCNERQAEILALQTKLQEHDGAVEDLLSEARQSEIDLRAQLARQISEQQALESRAQTREAELLGSLSAKDTDLQRLRVATDAARERIDSVLARLPGAAAEDQSSGAQP